MSEKISLIGCNIISDKSNIIKSANLPSSILPIKLSLFNAFAPFIVASFNIS